MTLYYNLYFLYMKLELIIVRNLNISLLSYLIEIIKLNNI